MIFVFLKFFGKNEFDVPVMFTSGPQAMPAFCDEESVAPYRVPEHSAISLNEITAVAFLAGQEGNKLTDYRFQLKRLVTEFEGSGFNLVLVDTIRSHADPEIRMLGSEAYLREMRCRYLLPDGFHAALIDDKRQIRGQYEATQKDTERMAVEVKILLKNY